jgi:hypothetical protein
VLSKGVEHDLVGLTISDGFKFGCGFSLALTVGFLVTLVVLTALVAMGVMLGFKLPLFG